MLWFLPAVSNQLFPLLSYTRCMLTRQHDVNLNAPRCTLNGFKYFMVHNRPYI